MKPTSLTPPSETPLLLAFGAHPDDIEFGCGGVIAREVQLGAVAHFVVGSRGEAATRGTSTERTREAQQGAAILGATLEFVELGGDAHLEYGLAHVVTFARIIRRLRPRILFAPTIVENQHPDHVVIGRLVRDAARLARYGGVEELRDLPPHAIDHLFFYAITVEGEPRDGTGFFVDVSEPSVLAKWTEAMAAHGSQSQTRNYVDLQLTRARLNGLRCGVSQAITLFPCDPLVVASLGQLGLSARRF